MAEVKSKAQGSMRVLCPFKHEAATATLRFSEGLARPAFSDCGNAIPARRGAMEVFLVVRCEECERETGELGEYRVRLFPPDEASNFPGAWPVLWRSVRLPDPKQEGK